MTSFSAAILLRLLVCADLEMRIKTANDRRKP